MQRKILATLAALICVVVILIPIISIGSAKELHTCKDIAYRKIGKHCTITYEIWETSPAFYGWVYIVGYKLLADVKSEEAKKGPNYPDPFYTRASLVKNVKKLTPYTSDTWDESPSFSLDGSKIVFESCRIAMGNPIFADNVWIMDIDGNNKKRLSKSVYYDGCPSFSPDRTKIVFESAPKTVTSSVKKNLWVMNIDGSNQKQVKIGETQKSSSWSPSETERATYPSWSPDGNTIVFESYHKVWTINSDGSNLTLLTPNHVVDLYPFWSPDGNKIIFVSSKYRKDNETGFWIFWDTTDIWTMDSDGGNRKQLTDDDAIEWEPSYSPDGKKIVFASPQSGIPSIWIMDSDCINKQQLTFKYPAEQPKWSPEGTEIVFASNGDIWMMTLNVTPAVALTPTVTPSPIQLTPTPTMPSSTLTQTSSPTLTPKLTSAPTPTATEIPIPEEKGVPGFKAIFALAGLLAVAYFLRKRR